MAVSLWSTQCCGLNQAADLGIDSVSPHLTLLCHRIVECLGLGWSIPLSSQHHPAQSPHNRVHVRACWLSRQNQRSHSYFLPQCICSTVDLGIATAQMFLSFHWENYHQYPFLPAVLYSQRNRQNGPKLSRSQFWEFIHALCISCLLQPCVETEGFIESLKLEIPLRSASPTMNLFLSMSLSKTSALFLEPSRNGDYTTSLGRLFQYPTIVSEKKGLLISNLVLPCYVACMLSLLSLTWKDGEGEPLLGTGFPEIKAPSLSMAQTRGAAIYVHEPHIVLLVGSCLVCSFFAMSVLSPIPHLPGLVWCVPWLPVNCSASFLCMNLFTPYSTERVSSSVSWLLGLCFGMLKSCNKPCPGFRVWKCLVSRCPTLLFRVPCPVSCSITDTSLSLLSVSLQPLLGKACL